MIKRLKIHKVQNVKYLGESFLMGFLNRSNQYFTNLNNFYFIEGSGEDNLKKLYQSVHRIQGTRHLRELDDQKCVYNIVLAILH